MQKKDTSGNEQKESLLTWLVQNVLKNPYIWGMALTYFFIYVVRQGVTSWFVFYLMKVRHAGCCQFRCTALLVLHDHIIATGRIGDNDIQSLAPSLY